MRKRNFHRVVRKWNCHSGREEVELSPGREEVELSQDCEEEEQSPDCEEVEPSPNCEEVEPSAVLSCSEGCMLTPTVNFAGNQTNTYLASREGGRGSFSNGAVKVNTLGGDRIWWTRCQRSTLVGRVFLHCGCGSQGC